MQVLLLIIINHQILHYSSICRSHFPNRLELFVAYRYSNEYILLHNDRTINKLEPFPGKKLYKEGHVYPSVL